MVNFVLRISNCKSFSISRHQNKILNLNLHLKHAHINCCTSKKCWRCYLFYPIVNIGLEIWFRNQTPFQSLSGTNNVWQVTREISKLANHPAWFKAFAFPPAPCANNCKCCICTAENQRLIVHKVCPHTRQQGCSRSEANFPCLACAHVIYLNSLSNKGYAGAAAHIISEAVGWCVFNNWS